MLSSCERVEFVRFLLRFGNVTHRAASVLAGKLLSRIWHREQGPGDKTVWKIVADFFIQRRIYGKPIAEAVIPAAVIPKLPKPLPQKVPKPNHATKPGKPAIIPPKTLRKKDVAKVVKRKPWVKPVRRKRRRVTRRGYPRPANSQVLGTISEVYENFELIIFHGYETEIAALGGLIKARRKESIVDFML